jgi:hypothetical protein
MQGVGRADGLSYFKCLADAVPCERLPYMSGSSAYYSVTLMGMDSKDFTAGKQIRGMAHMEGFRVLSPQTAT